MGFGEIAPLPEFGSESLTEAIAFCQQLPSQLSLHDINAVPNELSACQFGVGMAWETMTQVAIHSPELSIVMPKSDVNICQLLPTGDAALQACKALCQIGHRTFKWKIGVAPIEQECAYLTRLARSMPFDVRIRLDANGGLNWSLANQWLALCDRLQSSQHATIELLEQPLPPSQFEQMLALSQQYATPIALDESVATLQQLQTCYDRGWRSIVVIKAAIAGFPWRLREFCQNTHIDSVWSSVFETAIAQQFILNTLIPAVPYRERSLGFGVNHWFADGMTDGTPQQLWECLNS
jgi:O-succinylbenzoate synthase